MKFKGIFILFIVFTLLGLNTAYSMNTVKGWVNKVKPGTFETEDNSADSKPEEEVFSKSKIAVLSALKKREVDLKKKEDLYQQKTKELKILSQQIEQKLDQMRSLATRIEDQRVARKQMDEKDISKMVKYYETMAPENTAVFFNKMDRQTATHLLMRMNPRKASAVMQLLDPKVAVDITEKVTRFTQNRAESGVK